MWSALELVLGKPFDGVEVHEVDVVASINESFGEPGHPD
jgi:hypothetical protein